MQRDALRDIITVRAESKHTRHDTACSDRVTRIACGFVFSQIQVCVCARSQTFHTISYTNHPDHPQAFWPEASLEATAHRESPGAQRFSLPRGTTDTSVWGCVSDQTVDIVAHSHLHMLTHCRELEKIYIFNIYFQYLNCIFFC